MHRADPKFGVTVKETLIRAARTFFQTAIGVYMASLLGGEVTSLGAFADVSALDSAAAAGMVALLSFTQNWLENLGGVSYNRG